MNGRVSITAIALSVFLIVFSGYGFCADKAPVDVVKAAKEGLSRFSRGPMAESLSLADARVGFGFRVHTINPKTLVDEKDSSLTAMVTPMDIWRFLLVSKGKPVALLTVGKLDGVWQPVAIGGVDLAKEIDEVAKAWPVSKGYSFRFVRIFQARSDLMEIQKGHNSMGFASLRSARMALSLDSHNLGAANLMNNSQLLEPLRDVVSRELMSKRHREDKTIDSQED